MGLREVDGGESSPDRAAPGVPRQPVKRPVGSRQDQALALQRLAGNRATVQALARWTAHPDPEKKGVIVPDVVAGEYARFNPPKNQ